MSTRPLLAALADADDRPGSLDGDIVRVPASAVQARRHPGALVGLWAWQAVLALVVSAPATALVSTAFKADPRGDATLWAAGGRALIAFLWQNARGLAVVARLGETVAFGNAVLGLIPLAAAMFAMARARRDGRAMDLARCVGAALQALPTLSMLLLLTTAAQAIAIVVGSGIAGAVETWARPIWGEAIAHGLEGMVALVFLGAVSALNVVQDLARAALMRFDVRALRAVGIGARVFGHAPGLWWSWAWRALASLAPPIIAASVTDPVDPSTRGALILLALLHQAVLLSRVAIRTSWLAKALRSVDDPPPFAAYRGESER